MRVLVSCLSLFLCIFSSIGGVHAHGELMRIGSSQDRGGQLVVATDFDFSARVVVTPLIRLGGQTFYTNIIPSFTWVLAPSTSPPPTTHSLRSGTQVRFQLVAIAAGASVKLSGSTLDVPGESALIGAASDSDAHFHPEWALTLPDDVVGEYQLSFKLTTSSASYGESPTYTLTLTNRPPESTATPTATTTVTTTPSPSRTLAPSPSATPVATSTATATPPLPTASPSPTSTASPSPTPSATRTPRLSPGDANCDKRSSAADMIATVYAQLDPTPWPCDADLSRDGLVDESDRTLLVQVLFR